MSTSLAEGAAIPIDDSDAIAVAWKFKNELRVTAIVKASFAFADEGPMPRAETQPIAQGDVHHGGNRLRSIVLAGDLAPYKKKADVLFTGHAHAAGGRAESQTVRLALVDGARAVVDKTLVVRKKGGFQKLRLAWEHTAGGPGNDENPFGEGAEDDEDEGDLHVFHPTDTGRAAGFAPVPPNMAPRRGLLAGAALPASGGAPVEIAASFPFEALQVAPADQRAEFLRGDETIVLEGLSARKASLRMRLPGARAVARIHGLSGAGIAEGTPLAMYADTLHIRGDEERCDVTWRGTFAVPGRAQLGALRIAAAVTLHGAAPSWPDDADLARLAARRAAAVPAGSPAIAAGSTGQTMPLSDADIEVVSSVASARRGLSPAETLALVTPKSGSPSPVVRESRSHARPVDATLPVPSARGARTHTAGGHAKSATLPFKTKGEGSSSAAVYKAASGERRPATSAGETLPVASRRSRGAKPVLPFEGLSPEPAPMSEAPAANAPGGDSLQVEAAASTSASPPEAPAARPEVAAAKADPTPAKAEPAPPKSGSPWKAAPEPETPAPAPKTPKKLPPKVDVRGKLYGSSKKGR